MNNNQHDLSDDELDRIFSDAAENTNFDFDPDSWTKMSQKLDEVYLPAASKPWQKRALILLIGLLFLTGTYYFIKKSTNQVNITQNSTQNNAKDDIIKDNIIEGKWENNKTNVSTKSSVEKLVIDNKISTKESINNTNSDRVLEQKSLQNKISFENEVSSTTSNKIKASKTKNEVLLNKSLVDNSIVFERNKAAKNRVFEENKTDNVLPNQAINTENSLMNYVNESEAISKENSSRLTLTELQQLSSKGTFIQSKFNLPAIVFENKIATQTNIPASKSIAFKKGLYLRLATSPELSLVTMDEMAKLGNDWAALLEYRFNSRLSIHSGIIRSMKYYNAYPEGYQWPSNWKQPPALININASCKMLDIPLNVRYDITQKTKSRLFVSTGITSYVMLNEKYVYNYENPADPAIKWKNWEGKTGMYKLSTINFSTGYEYQLFRKLSVQVEPFVKVPVSKVGFGKVNLSTVGVFFSAKYPLK